MKTITSPISILSISGDHAGNSGTEGDAVGFGVGVGVGAVTITGFVKL